MSTIHFDIAHEVGSREFERPLIRLGLPVRVRYLSCADFAFYGNGPSGTVRVGVERKTLSEMLGEASRKRLNGRQLPKMSRRFQYRFLIVEGRIRVETSRGELLKGKDITSGKGQLMTLWFPSGFSGYSELYENFLKRELTLRLRGAMQVIPTGSREETAMALHALYRWFQKDWSAHRSALALDTITEAEGEIVDERSWRRDILAKFPGVGWKRSKRVANYFPSVGAACAGTVDDWQQALGFKAGRTVATKIVQYVHGQHEHVAKGS